MAKKEEVPKGKIEQMKEKIGEMNEKSREYIKDHPMTIKTAGYVGAALVGATLGFLLGRGRKDSGKKK